MNLVQKISLTLLVPYALLLSLSGQWLWVTGTITSNDPGTYGTKGTAASTNIPGARQSGASWTDTSGNLWLFGGYGFDSVANGDKINDLWKYQP